MMIKRILLAVVFLSISVICLTAQDYERRYNLLVSQVGPAGVGVETLLDNWARAEKDNDKMLIARFHYYLLKSQGSEIVTRPERKYLGTDPVLTLKDSTGADVYYFEVLKYDDELFREAVAAVDRAIEVYPDRLELRFMKINAYVSYERESPDMALANLIALASDFDNGSSEWIYEGETADDEFFAQAMQEYCYTFYTLGTSYSYEAFRRLSEVMNGYYPDDMSFVCNIGSYHMMVKGDYKTALKYYTKVLKKNPTDYSAIRNSTLAARKMGNVKLEKKYLKLLMEHGTDSDKLQAQARLSVLEK